MVAHTELSRPFYWDEEEWKKKRSSFPALCLSDTSGKPSLGNDDALPYVDSSEHKTLERVRSLDDESVETDVTNGLSFKNGVLFSGTVEALVSRVTDVTVHGKKISRCDGAEKSFLADFFYAYRNFLTPGELLSRLITM